MTNKSLTLIELVIAISLMSVVILGAIAFDSASRTMMASSERKTVILNEFSLISDYFSRDGALVAADGGTGANTGIYAATINPWDFHVMMHQDVSGTPSNYADDVVVDYHFDNSTNSISRNGQVLSNRFVTPMSAINFNITNSVGTTFDVYPVILRYNPALPVDNSTNPQITGNFFAHSSGSSDF